MTETNTKKQFLAALSCNLISFSYGTSCAWATSNFMTLQSPDTPLKSGPLTVSEASLVISLLCIGGLTGNLLIGIFAEKFGRKIPLLFLGIPQILSWCLILIGHNVFYLYASRLLAGIVGGGVLILVPLFVSEIAEDRVRGTLGSLLILTCNAGILFGFIIGNYFEYFAQVKILLTVPILFLLSFNLFPETPEYLLLCGDKKSAKKSLSFYQGVTKLELVEQDVEKIKECVKEPEQNNKLSFSDFLKPAAKKALFIGIFLSTLNQLCGCFAMMNYTTAIFEEAGSTLSPNQSAIVIAVVQLVANCVTTVLVDRAGRKVLFTSSAIGTSLALISLGVHSVFKAQLESYNWIPIVSFSLVIFIASVGMLPLQFVILVELLPKKIKNAATSISLSLLWIIGFILLKFYPIMSQELGMHGCMFFFASCCFCGALFIIFVIPETKGKSHDEIMQALEK